MDLKKEPWELTTDKLSNLRIGVLDYDEDDADGKPKDFDYYAKKVTEKLQLEHEAEESDSDSDSEESGSESEESGSDPESDWPEEDDHSVLRRHLMEGLSVKLPSNIINRLTVVRGENMKDVYSVIDIATARAVIARDNVRWGRIIAKKLMSVRHNRRYTAILLQAPNSADLTSVRPPTFTRMETTSVIRIKRPWRGWKCAETVFLK